MMPSLLGELGVSGSYAKPIGIMELVKFMDTATPEQIKDFKHYRATGDTEAAWNLVQSVTGTKLREAERYTQASKQIRTKLRGAGYKLLGSGADATVWAKDTGTVVKIIMPDDGTGAGTAGDTFMKFYNFCKENSGVENLPRFSGREVEAFTEDGKEYIMVTMERLTPIPEGSFQEAMVWLLSHLATKRMEWPGVLKAIRNPESWKHIGADFDPAGIVATWNGLDRKSVYRYQILYHLMTLLYHRGNINKIGWDLHTENAMMRGNTIVITDPWFNDKMDIQ